MSIDEKTEIEMIIQAIHHAKQIKGDVDMPRGEYTIALKRSDDSEIAFHLLISSEYTTGTVMEINSTTYAYNLTKNDTEQIREILFK